MPNTLSDRTFGVELELVGISMDDMAEAINNIPGCSAVNEGYNHTLRTHWKIVSDGSIDYENGGGEVVSPVLKGEEGIQELVKVTKALKQAGARINRSCGMHVHVGVDDLTSKDLINIVKRYARYEETIDSFMPSSRRGNAQWCRSVISFSSLLDSSTSNSPEQVVDSQRGRYYKVNLKPYSRQKTIEFRQHAGTCNYKKVENWVRFSLGFTEVSIISTPEERRNQRASITSSQSRTGLRGVAAKMERVRLAFLANNNHSLPPVAIAALGSWGIRSVPVYVSRMRTELGLRIACRHGVYFLLGSGEVRLPASETSDTEIEHLQAARTVTIEDTLFGGMPESVAEFYNNRIRSLGGTD